MTTHDVQKIELRLIKRGDNDRTVFKEKDIAELADDIRQNDLIQPITVRPINAPDALYEIVAGERRSLACRHLGWTHIPAIVRKLTDEQASRIMLSENIKRVDIGAIEEAHAYRKRMEQFSWSVSQTADAANVGEKRVKNRLLLLELVPEAQHLIQTNQMGVQFGECLAQLDHNRQRIALKYFSQSDRAPLFREFQAVVSKLLEEQTQDSMIDLSTLVAQAVEEHNADHAAWRKRSFPVDEVLPLMKRVGTIGMSLETYIHQLTASESDHYRAAAPIVGRIYQSMLQTGMCYPPRRERNSPLEKHNS